MPEFSCLIKWNCKLSYQQKPPLLVLATPINKGPFVISGGFQFIDTYLASRAGGIRVRGVIFALDNLVFSILPKKQHKYFSNVCPCIWNVVEFKLYVFCYQNCSDLLWEKIVLVIEKIFEITTTIHSVSYYYAVLPFYDVKCLCSRGRELGREGSHSH